MVASALGTLIRDMRTARGWSQAQLAVFLNTESDSPTLTRNDVSRWENGKRSPRFWLSHLASVFDVDLRDLASAAGHARSSVRLDRAPASERAERPTAAWDVFPSAGRVEGGHTSRSEQVRALDAIRSQLAGYAYLLGEQRTPRPPQLRSAAVEANRAYQAAEYGRAATMLPEILRAADTYDGCGGRDGRETNLARCMAYAVSAKLLTKVGEAQLGWLAADRATHAAMAVDSVAAQGVAAYQVACALLHSDRPEDAERVAVRAAEGLMAHAKSEAPEVVSLAGALWLIAAVIAARQTDRSTALARLAIADGLAALLPHDGNHAWTAFGPTNVHIHRSSVQAELGDPCAVLQIGMDIDVEALPAGLNGRRSRVCLDRAWAQTQLRNDIEAMLHLQEAERIAPEILRFETVARGLVQELLERARQPKSALRAMAARAGVLS